MSKPKLIRITTVPISLEKLLEGQLRFMAQHFDVIAMSAEPEQLAKFGTQNQLRVQSLPLTRKITPLQDLRAIYSLYRFLRKERPQIVHTHTPKAGMVGMIAARLARIPHRLHTVAGLPVMETTGFKRSVLSLVERLTYAMSTMVYPNSFELKRYIQNQGWAQATSLKVLHNGSSNGIDTSYFDPKAVNQTAKQQWQEELGLPQTDTVFVFVGRLVGDKGINELVTAFDSISDQRKDIHLLLVGPQEEELDPLNKQTTEKIKNNRRIHSLGYQQDVRPFLALADILVFPSYREGFPNVVLQAAAMGLPSIVSDINGCNEIITHLENGLIVPAKDALSLTAAMNKLLDEPELMNNLRAVARPSIVSRFDRFEFWEVLLKEYRQILNS